MKKIISLLLVLMMVFSLVACGAPAVEETQAPTENQTEATTEEQTEAVVEETGVSYPITLTDMAGREVTIESEPQRIVSGYYISTSACIALGLQDRVVGIESKSNKRPIYSLAAPELLELPNVGTAKEFDLETCLSTEPDLVILPMKQKDTAAALAELGIPALLVMPESHEQIAQMFTLIATAANVVEKADALISYYNAELAEVEALAAGAEQPVVYITGTSSYLTTAPGQMYQSSLITTAGGAAAGAGIEGTSWVELSYEDLLTMNPDIIVVPTNSLANGSADFAMEDLLNDAELSEVTAIKNGAVYQMTIGFEAWDSPAPSGILGVKWMLKTIHPELYSADEFAADVQEFYETFYGFTPDAGAING